MSGPLMACWLVSHEYGGACLGAAASVSRQSIGFAGRRHLRRAARLLIVEVLRLHRPRSLVVAVGVVARGLRRIAVDQRSHEQRMGQAAHLVLDREQVLAGVKIGDVAEAVLILVVLA